MSMKVLIISIAALLIAGCATNYSNPITWTNSNDQIIQFTAHYRMGTMGKEIIIYQDGQPIMKQGAHYWTNQVVMTTKVDGQPASAVCGGEDGAKTCKLTIAGQSIGILTFRK